MSYKLVCRWISTRTILVPGPGLGVVLMSRCRAECKVLSVVCRVGWTLNCCSGLHQYIIHFLTTTCNLMSSIKAKAPYRSYRVPERRELCRR